MDWVGSSQRVDWEGTMDGRRDSASDRRDDMNSDPMKLSIVQIELGLEGSRVMWAVFIWDDMWAIRPSGENRLLVLILFILISLVLALVLALVLGLAGFCFFLFAVLDDPPNPPAANAVSGRVRNGEEDADDDNDVDDDDVMSASNMQVREVRMRCERIIIILVILVDFWFIILVWCVL